MTGAPVPDGADCVVMVEHVQRNGNTLSLTQGRSIASGENIVPRGAEARAGEVILPPGTRISAAQVAAAAACGAAQLNVFAQPRVAIVATGDELVEVDQQPLVAPDSQLQQLFARGAGSRRRRPASAAPDCAR